MSEQVAKTSSLINDPDVHNQWTTSVEHYAGKDGLSVTRFNFLDNGNAKSALEAVSQGNDVLIAISADGQKHLDALIGLAPKGTMSQVLDGWVDIPMSFAAMSQMSAATDMPEALVKDLGAKCKGQRLNFTLQGENHAMTMTVALPVSLLKVICTSLQTSPDEKAQKAAAKAQLAALRTALETYEVDNGHFPYMNEGGLQALVTNPGLNTWKNGGYLDKSALPKDPWGRDYVYQRPGSNGADYDLYSTGSDGKQRIEP